MLCSKISMILFLINLTVSGTFAAAFFYQMGKFPCDLYTNCWYGLLLLIFRTYSLPKLYRATARKLGCHDGPKWA